MTSTTTMRQQGDAELIVGARKGDADAYGELYRRHADAARSAARALTRSRADADDVVSEAFARVLRALQRGGGPEVSFRPYLITAVRNVFYDRVRRSREEPTDDLADDVNLALLDAAGQQEEGALAAAAFATLPERWQLVLWHTEVEGRSAAEVAPLLGLAPNAVAALAYRAREGLRQAYLQAHLREQTAAECRACSANLGAYVRDGLSTRDRRKVEAHLDGCATCRGLVGELASTNTTLRAALLPALLGVPAAAYLGGLGGGGITGWFARLPKAQQVLAGAGATTASVVAAATLAVAALGGGDDAGTASTAPAVTADAPGEGAGTGTGTTVTLSPTTVTTAAASTSAPTTTVSATSAPGNTGGTASATTAAKLPPATTAAPATSPSTTTATTTATTTTTTTTVGTPASLAIATAQLSPAVAGGELRLGLAVTNTGATPSGAVTIELPLPTGAAFRRVEKAAAVPTVVATDGDWTCTAAIRCSLPGLAAGGSARVVLTVALSPTAPPSLTFHPSVSAPPGADVTSEPITVTIDQVRGLLTAETSRGAVQAIGNSVMTCTGSTDCALAQQFGAQNNDHHAYDMAYVNTAGGQFNSSSAQLALAGTVSQAFLVWGGVTAEGQSLAPSPSARGTVTFITPSGPTVVAADELGDGAGGVYTAVADVTHLVSSSGTYAVADVQTVEGEGTFGGWSLVVVVHHEALPERWLLVTAPLHSLSPERSYHTTVTLPGDVPMGAHVVAIGFEGDPGLAGDRLDVGTLTIENPFRSEVPGVRTPGAPNTFGLDIVTTPMGTAAGPDLTVTASTGNDRVQLAFVAIVVEPAAG